ncbi:MAG TPA: hypothetical protein VEK11_16010 [Thermoanaerobaculia bacterium]|jgi:hypothetical protein|nr:hypothetical protein [Thermoanaerobaculia bacterium]
MSRRPYAVMAALALAAPLALASDANDRVCTRDVIPGFSQIRPELAALFVPAAEPVDTGDAVFTTGPLELLVVRLGEDGKPVAVCVDNEEAAQKFLDAPIQRVVTKQAKEQ